VRSALDRGLIEASRYQIYQRLFAQLSPSS